MRKTVRENLKSMPLTVFPKIDIEKDLLLKQDFITNSWFVCGHFEADGHILNYFYDVLIGGVPGQASLIVDNMSVTDQTTKETFDYSQANSKEMCSISTDSFSISTPHATFGGTLDHFTLKAKMKDVELDINLTPMGFPLYNAGDGNFNIADLSSFEYSLPEIETQGTITIKGVTYELNGISWLDRQWGGDLKAPTDTIPIVPRWAWMNLNLDNKDFLSLWSIPIGNNQEVSWVTVLHPDGSHNVLYVEPMLPKVEKYYHSDITGIDYPVHWNISIPEINANLEVISDPINQEVYSEEVPDLTHFEGASFIKGTYHGNNVTGHCYVELMNWGSKMEDYISNSQ